ncbi:MAG: HAMP domain-containing histidine kinase, partial [Ignavibacteriae bacterium]|nr:HAMP domain-containing histidine kinase [Ignavibacteriota bacterium]
KDTEFAIINVRDGGKGIEQNKLKKITDPFFTTKRNKGGTGLGLSITSKIIMQHKGSLNFDSKENFGTTATIKIPLRKP